MYQTVKKEHRSGKVKKKKKECLKEGPPGVGHLSKKWVRTGGGKSKATYSGQWVGQGQASRKTVGGKKKMCCWVWKDWKKKRPRGPSSEGNSIWEIGGGERGEKRHAQIRGYGKETVAILSLLDGGGQ